MSSFSKKVLHKLEDELDGYLDDNSQEDYKDSDHEEYEEDSFENSEDNQEQIQQGSRDSRASREQEEIRSQDRQREKSQTRAVEAPQRQVLQPASNRNQQATTRKEKPRNLDGQNTSNSNLQNFLDDTSPEESVDEDTTFLGAEDTDNMLDFDGSSKIPDPPNKTPPPDPNQFFGSFDFGRDTDDNSRSGLSTKTRLGNQSPSKPTNVDTKSKKEEDSEADEETETLYQWCEQFSYQPGVEYVRLKRLHPKTWEGIPLSGWIEDLYEPMDEQDLMARWGGGTYMFESIQLDKLGRPRAAKKKIVMISGLPTHFVDDQGKPYRLPNSRTTNSNSTHSWREDMILGARNRGLGKFNGGRDYQDQNPSYGYQEDSNRTSNRGSGNTQSPQPQQPTPSAAELFRITQAQAEAKKEDHKALEILRSAQNDAQSQMSEVSRQQQEIYKEMLKRQAEEIERMRKEQDAILEKAQTPLKDALSVVSNRADNEVSVLKQQIQKLELEARDRLATFKDEQSRLFQNHQHEKDDLRAIYLKQIEDLRVENNRLFQNFQKEKDDLKNISLTQIETLRQEYRQRESDIRVQAQSTSSENLQALKMQMDNLRDSHQAQVTNIQKESQATINQLYQEISKLREDARERESKARDEAFKRESDLKIAHVKEINDVKNESSERINNLRLDNEKKEKEIKSTYELREKDLKERLDEKEKTLRESLEGKYQITIETLKERLEALKSTSEEKIREYIQNTDKRESQMQKLLEANYKAQISNIESDRERLKSDLETLRRELDSYKREKKELTDPIMKLKEIKNFKSTLQEFGFVSEDDNHKESATALALIKRKQDDDDDDDDDDGDKKKKKEEPKGILGQIAHYGPAIATNILGPVLQRVDSATKVANDALETQKQELTNQAKLLELQAQEMEQNRFKLQQESNVLRARQTQLVQQQQAQSFNQAQMRAAANERQKRVLQDRRMMREQQALGQPQPQVQNFSNRTNAVLGRPQGIPPQQVMPPQNVPPQQVMPPQNAPLQRRPISPIQSPRNPSSIPRPITPSIVEDVTDPSIPSGYTPLEEEMFQVASNLEEDFVASEPMSGTPIVSPRLRNFGQKSNRTSMAQDRLKSLNFGRKQTTENLNKNLTIETDSFINDEIQSNNDPTISSQESESNMGVSEGYIKLAEFLNEQMKDDVSAEDAANKLKTGMMLGLVPKDVFNEAIQNSFEDLYSNVRLAAEQRNFSKLTTPKGESYCQKLYNKLKA